MRSSILYAERFMAHDFDSIRRATHFRSALVLSLVSLVACLPTVAPDFSSDATTCGASLCNDSGDSLSEGAGCDGDTCTEAGDSIADPESSDVGCTVDLAGNDPKNCGACGRDCTYGGANPTATCTSGVCSATQIASLPDGSAFPGCSHPPSDVAAAIDTTVSETRVYVATLDTIYSVPKLGGAASVLLTSICDAVAINDSGPHVGVAAWGAAYTFPAPSGDGPASATRVASFPTGEPEGIYLDETMGRVYVGTGLGIMLGAIGGPDSASVNQFSNKPSTGVWNGPWGLGENICWTDSDQSSIYSGNPTGVLQTCQSRPVGAANGTSLVWVNWGSPPSLPTSCGTSMQPKPGVYSSPFAPSAPPVLLADLSVPPLAQAPNIPSLPKLSHEAVYWIDEANFGAASGSNQTAGVYWATLSPTDRVPHAVAVEPTAHGPLALTVDTESVYWTETDGTNVYVLKVPLPK